jgi:hypothetical protein
MENFEGTQKTGSQTVIGDGVKAYLLETTRWGNFLAIMGYIGMGFLCLAGFMVSIGFSLMGSSSDISFPLWILGVIYIVMAVVYYFPVTFLYRFSKNLKQGLLAGSNDLVTLGFENLKSLFRFMGILTIVVLSIYAVFLVVALPLILILAK